MTTDAQEQDHGEFKVPGGKLVVSDIVTDGSRITGAKISGDFFLEPEGAFDALAPALIGASVAEDSGKLSRRLEVALSHVSQLLFAEPAPRLLWVGLNDLLCLPRAVAVHEMEFCVGKIQQSGSRWARTCCSIGSR